MALTELFGESVRPVWTKSIRMKTKSCDFGGKIRLCGIAIYEKAKTLSAGEQGTFQRYVHGDGAFVRGIWTNVEEEQERRGGGRFFSYVFLEVITIVFPPFFH